MQNVLNPMVTMYQTQLEASRRFADAIFSGTEKIDHVVIGATHRVFTEQLNFAQAMATVRDPRAVGSTLQSSFLSRSPDNVVNYQKEIMRIFAEMQNEIGRSMQEYVEQLGTHAATSATMPLEAAQERANNAVFNPMTSMFSVWESAFKEVAELAKKNMMAARSTMEDAASSYVNVAAGSARETASAVESASSSTAQAARHATTAATAAGEEGGEEKRGSPQSGGGGGGKKK